MSPQEEPSKPPSGGLFDAIGSQVEQVAATGTAAAETAEAADTADNDEARVVDEIESLCMNCHDNGITRLLLTRIPYFREIIVMSFYCEHCGFRNNEIQAAGAVQPRGTHYELRLTTLADLSRQVVKADSATAKFIELDVEIPAGRGQLTNVEGLLSELVSDLEMDQEERRTAQPEVFTKIEELLATARAMRTGTRFPFRLSIDDPAGNSWIAPDPHDGVGQWERREYLRTPQQNEALGLTNTEAASGATGASGEGTGAGTTTSSSGIPALSGTADGVIPLGGQGRLSDSDDIVPNEVYTFPASCPGCMHPCVTHMKMVDIPHFQQVVLMSTLCDQCGYRSNDVKTGGAVPARGRRIRLRVTEPADLARDILKSESCALACAELNLSVNPGTLGGRFTTVEGLLTQVRDDLRNQIFRTGDGVGGTSGTAPTDPAAGDSLTPQDRSQWSAFFTGLDDAIAGRIPFTVVLEDPLACSYVQSLADDPSKPDAQMTIEEYDRTSDEEEELGLHDMKTEGYQPNAAVPEAPAAGEASANQTQKPGETASSSDQQS